jgi:hypothetical protein
MILNDWRLRWRRGISVRITAGAAFASFRGDLASLSFSRVNAVSDRNSINRSLSASGDATLLFILLINYLGSRKCIGNTGQSFRLSTKRK